MNGLRDSTIQWYLTWLEESRKDLTEAQRYEMAVGFTDAQCTKPPVDDDEVSDDEIVELIDATDRANMRKAARAEEKLGEMIAELQNEQPVAKIEVLRDRPRRLADFKP